MANHAKAIVACDFLAVVTATFKCLYVLVIIEISTRKLLHIHVTDHQTATWTLYYNRSRPHMSLGPHIPSPPEYFPVRLHPTHHRIAEDLRVSARPVLGVLHHDYQLVVA